MSLGVNPLAWMIGFYGMSATVALSRHTALRADGTYVRLRDDFESYEFELGMPIYPLAPFHGPFIEPGVSLRRSRGSAFVNGLEDPPPRYSDRPVSHLRGATFLFGWHWMTDSGVNLAVAAGVALLSKVPSERARGAPGQLQVLRAHSQRLPSARLRLLTRRLVET
ncbi:MAG: hypothetical protein IPI49_32515 [Myxococcales bacterium]|nr:hypothetical protein [Myxococcales bacterium]